MIRSTVRTFLVGAFWGTTLFASKGTAWIPSSATPSCQRSGMDWDAHLRLANTHPRRPLPSSIYKSRSTTGLSSAASFVVRTIPVASDSTYLVRICFLRALALVHLVAFWTAWRQNKALIGDDGLSPAKAVLAKAQAEGKAKRTRRLEWRQDMEKINHGRKRRSKRPIWKRFQQAIEKRVDKRPSLVRWREMLWDRSISGRPTTTPLWLAKDRDSLNPWLDGIAILGMRVPLRDFRSRLRPLLVPLVRDSYLSQQKEKRTNFSFPKDTLFDDDARGPQPYKPSWKSFICSFRAPVRPCTCGEQIDRVRPSRI